MEAIQDWAQYAYDNQDMLLHFVPYASQVKGVVSTIQGYLYPLILKLIEKPDLATIALLLVIVLISLKILDMLWQSVKFWFRMAYKIVFWGGLAVGGLWLWTRGPDGVAEDVQYYIDTWSHNYEHFKAQEKAARLGHQKPMYGKARNSWY